MQLNTKIYKALCLLIPFCVIILMYQHNSVDESGKITYETKQINYNNYNNLNNLNNLINENISFISNISEIVNYVKIVNNYLTEYNVTVYNPGRFERVESKITNEKVILIITSCGRWDKLSKVIESFERYNTYKHMLAKYVLDDCDDIRGFNKIKSKYGLNTSYQYNFINGVKNPFMSLPRKHEFRNRGFRPQGMIRLFLKNIYSKNKTLLNAKYAFLTEDDWQFYEYGFIEDSFSILYGSKIWNHSVVFFKLRNTQFDPTKLGYQKQHYPMGMCGGEYYELNNDKSKPIYISSVLGYGNRMIPYWVKNVNRSVCTAGYANGAHLQNINQYLSMDKIKNITINRTDINTIYGETEFGCFLKSKGYYIVYPIYNGYCKHIGWGGHTQQHLPNRQMMNKVNCGKHSDRCVPCNISHQ